MTKKNQDCSRRSLVAPKYCVCVVKIIAVTIVKVKSIGLEVNGSFNVCTLVDSGYGPIANYRQVQNEVVDLKSTKRGFKTIKNAVATYEQTKTRQSYFNLKEKLNVMEYTLNI